MKLDVRGLRYLSSDDFRVLTAVEMGTKNHEIVPTALITSIAHLKHGGVQRCLNELTRRKLLAIVPNAKYDGYRLTYGGYDYLALRAMAKKNSLLSVGNQIGVGKESDVYVVADEHGHQSILKIERLGRISFRAVKEKRDYLQNRQSASWMYLSRLAAAREFAFMTILHEHGFPVPKPIDLNRHCIIMEFIDAFPLRQVETVLDVGELHGKLMSIIVRLAENGLIHGDFNEFNLLVSEAGEITVIDFPQMVSISHANAKDYFDRDVECIATFFKRRFQFESDDIPCFEDIERKMNLDVLVAASGYSKKDQTIDS